MNSPTRYGGGTGYVLNVNNEEKNKKEEVDFPAFFFLMFLFFAILFGVSTGDNTKIERDKNGCRPVPRVGLVCTD